MPRTLDQFPGTRYEESIVFDSGSNFPSNSGELGYVTGTISGSGFFFNENGGVYGPVSSFLNSGSSIGLSQLVQPGQQPGDLAYFNGTTWTRLPAGASGSVLYSSGTAVPRWILPLKSSSLGLAIAPTTTSTAFILIPDMLMTASVQTPAVQLQFYSTFNMVHGDNWQAAAFVDGSEISGSRLTMAFNASSGSLVTNGSLPGAFASIDVSVVGLTSASHVFDVRWAVTTGTARTVGVQRSLSVKEIF
jgi:hypothetical protein